MQCKVCQQKPVVIVKHHTHSWVCTVFHLYYQPVMSLLMHVVLENEVRFPKTYLLHNDNNRDRTITSIKYYFTVLQFFIVILIMQLRLILSLAISYVNQKSNFKQIRVVWYQYSTESDELLQYGQTWIDHKSVVFHPSVPTLKVDYTLPVHLEIYVDCYVWLTVIWHHLSWVFYIPWDFWWPRHRMKCHWRLVLI